MDKTPGITQVITDLQSRFADRCSVNRDVLDRHGRGESWHEVKAPDIVVFP